MQSDVNRIYFYSQIEVEKGTYESKEVPVRKYLVEKILQYFSLDDESIARIWNESEAILSAVVQLKQVINNNKTLKLQCNKV